MGRKRKAPEKPQREVSNGEETENEPVEVVDEVQLPAGTPRESSVEPQEDRPVSRGQAIAASTRRKAGRRDPNIDDAPTGGGAQDVQRGQVEPERSPMLWTHRR